MFCKDLFWHECQEKSSWVYIRTPPYEFLSSAQLSQGTKQQLCVMSFLNRQSSDFFPLEFFIFSLSSQSFFPSLQGPWAAINFNTWRSNRCGLELSTHSASWEQRVTSTLSAAFQLEISSFITYQQRTPDLNKVSILLLLKVNPSVRKKWIVFDSLCSKVFTLRICWCWLKTSHSPAIAVIWTEIQQEHSYASL